MITTNDLIGAIQELPLAVVRLMLIRQYEATGNMDVSVFQTDRNASYEGGGFDWCDTPEDQMHSTCWARTLCCKNYAQVKELYKADVSVFPDNAALNI